MASDRAIRLYVTMNAAGALVGMDELQRKSTETANVIERTGGKMKSFGAGAVSLGRSLTAVSLPLAALGAYSVKSAIQFQTSMTLLQTQAGASAKEVGRLNKEVIGLSGKAAHGFGPNELAEALYPIRSDGFKAAQAMNVLSAASAGARVSGANLTLTANALGGALRTYGVSGPEAAAKAMDSLNATVGFGKFKLEELDEALTSGFLVAAKRAGIGLNETGDALDALARKSIPPQVEATRLQKTFIQFGTVTGIARKELASIGISQLQLAEDMKNHGLIYTLEDLQNHLKNLKSSEQNVVLGEAFGRSKGSANVGALLEALPEMKKIQKEREHYNTLQEALAVKEKTSQYQIDTAVAELKKSLIGLGQVLIPIVIPMFTKLAKIVQESAKWFQNLPKPIREFGIYAGIAAVTAGPLLIFFGNVVKSTGTLLTLIPKLTGLLPGFGAAAGAAGEEASGGIAALLLDIAPLIAAGAALVATYEAIKQIKDFFSSSYGGAKTPGAKAFKHMRQPSEFTANTHGALHMLTGGRIVHPGELALGSAAEAELLKRHAGYLGSTELGGSAAAETAEGRARRAARAAAIEAIEKAETHVHIELNGKQLAEAVATYARDNPSSLAAKHMAESVVKRAHLVQARS